MLLSASSSSNSHNAHSFRTSSGLDYTQSFYWRLARSRHCDGLLPHGCSAVLRQQLCSIQGHVPSSVHQTLVIALVLARLDYCDNATLASLPNNLLSRLCVCVCVSVCPWAYLRKYTSDLYQFLCLLLMAVARSSSGGVAIRYVLSLVSCVSKRFLFYYRRTVNDQ